MKALVLTMEFVARSMAVAIVVFFVFLAVGHGGVPVLELSKGEFLQFIAVFTAWIGLALISLAPQCRPKRLVLGAALSTAGIGGFYILNLLASGAFPGGPVFPAMPVPGVLILLCVFVRRHLGSMSL